MIVPYGDDVERTNFPFATLFITSINVLVGAWIVRITFEDTTFTKLIEFWEMWGLHPDDIAVNGYFNLVSHMFVHGDVFHLAGNLLVLWAFAPTLEELLGVPRYLALYFFTGLVAAATFIACNMEVDTVLVGASGAIAGVIGAYCLTCGPTAKIKVFFLLIFKPVFFEVPGVVFAVFWMASQYYGFLDEESAGGGVAFSAHIGGFASGMLLVVALKHPERSLLQIGDRKIIHSDEEAVDGEEEAEALQLRCEYCGVDLTEDDMIAPDLYRCPEADCGSMNIDPSKIPVRKSNRSQAQQIEAATSHS